MISDHSPHVSVSLDVIVVPRYTATVSVCKTHLNHRLFLQHSVLTSAYKYLHKYDKNAEFSFRNETCISTS